QLTERMAEADSMTARIAILETWLIKRLARGMECDPLIPASLDVLRTSGGSLPIPILAESFAISQRHLERLYQRQVGMSPKKYAQLLRVETARLALKDMRLPTTTHLAVELGFYDQSHFIREFQAVIGMTPYRYLRRSQAR
ncbi:MAG: helix-turn-helix domain-containing protein, partial [Anaerolineae bacterium]|nr:helix-turn-helix domain-containing protein [Anaerolineae bacterium]